MGFHASAASLQALPPWQHYLCWSDVPVPRISVIFSLEELKEIEKDCAIYVGRMERVARHSSISKEEKVHGHLPWGLPCAPLTPHGSQAGGRGAGCGACQMARLPLVFSVLVVHLGGDTWTGALFSLLLGWPGWWIGPILAKWWLQGSRTRGSCARWPL